jgi:hypothetical protein
MLCGWDSIQVHMPGKQILGGACHWCGLRRVCACCLEVSPDETHGPPPPNQLKGRGELQQAVIPHRGHDRGNDNTRVTGIWPALDPAGTLKHHKCRMVLSHGQAGIPHFIPRAAQHCSCRPTHRTERTGWKVHEGHLHCARWQRAPRHAPDRHMGSVATHCHLQSCSGDFQLLSEGLAPRGPEASAETHSAISCCAGLLLASRQASRSLPCQFR